MNALIGLLILSGVVYGIVVDGTFWKIYAVLASVYLVYSLWQRDARENPKRKTILISTWNCKFLDLPLRHDPSTCRGITMLCGMRARKQL